MLAGEDSEAKYCYVTDLQITMACRWCLLEWTVKELLLSERPSECHGELAADCVLPS